MGELIQLATKKTDNICRPVNKFKMNLNKQKIYKNCQLKTGNGNMQTPQFSQNTKFIKEWSVHLPALRTVKLDLLGMLFELEPTIFQNTINLECLDLSSGSIRSLDSKIFSYTKCLRVLIIECEIINLNENVFESLHSLNDLTMSHMGMNNIPPNLFKNLVNLDYLNLGGNYIKILPEGLFQNLVNLRILYLEDNEIDLSDQFHSIFQGLDNLRSLCLGFNLIKHIPEGIFRNLVNVKGVIFRYNQIAYFPEGFFRDLKSLKFLDISENGNEDLSKSIPSNITICEDEIDDLIDSDKDFLSFYQVELENAII